MDTYDPQAIEAKWQRVWEDARAFYVDDPPPGAEPDDKFYQLEMLPYPSGNLHMGHVLNYTLGDVVTHFQRRHGKQVLRPMGWDSFGLPAENAAISEGGHPREIIERNIDNIERQMHRLGWAIDWDRVIAAHDPAYYRWTQWLFLRFLEQGPRLPQGGGGQLVPARPDGAGERAGRERPLRTLRRRGRGPEAGAVVLPDHGLRRRAAARPRADRLA